MIFLKIAISEIWLQILKIAQSGQLRPKHASFWTLATRTYPTEQVLSILQPEIFTHFTNFRFECKTLKFE